MAHYTSKKGVVNSSAMFVFNRITDPFKDDSLSFEYAGYTIRIDIKEKVPFSRIVLANGEGAPFAFTVTVNLNQLENPAQCEMWIDAEADLNFMMRSLLGGKIQQGLDQAIDAFSTGKMPSF